MFTFSFLLATDVLRLGGILMIQSNDLSTMFPSVFIEHQTQIKFTSINNNYTSRHSTDEWTIAEKNIRDFINTFEHSM